MGISRRDRAVQAAGGDLVAEQCAIMARYARLWEFLTQSTFDDGSARVLPTLTLFCEGRMLKACCNDRAEGVVAFVTGASLTSILEALEEGISGDCLDWRKTHSVPRKR